MTKKPKIYNLTIKQRIKLHADQFKKYVRNAVIAGIVLFSLLFILTSIFKFYYIFSFAISYITSTTLAFILDKKLIFTGFSTKTLTKQYSHFFMTHLSFFALNLILLYASVEIFNLWYLLAQAIITLILIPLRFLIIQKYVFSKT